MVRIGFDEFLELNLLIYSKPRAQRSLHVKAQSSKLFTKAMQRAQLVDLVKAKSSNFSTKAMPQAQTV